MLFSRTVLFALWQSVFALGFRLAGSTRPWAASVPWWLLTASLGNITNIGLLAWMARREGFRDRKSTRLNSSHQIISYAVFCLKKKKKNINAIHKIMVQRICSSYV